MVAYNSPMALRAFGPYFLRSEFLCPCGCGLDTVDVELVAVLRRCRDYFGGRPLHVHSGCRCSSYNATLPGAAPNSYHIACKAADISIEGVSAAALAEYFVMTYPMCYGIGRYNDYVHIDMRPVPARWGFDIHDSL